MRDARSRHAGHPDAKLGPLGAPPRALGQGGATQHRLPHVTICAPVAAPVDGCFVEIGACVLP